MLERYFISSLAKEEASEQRMAAIIRSHWSCETRHWEHDTQWREDKCLFRDPNPACALALIRTGLQTLLTRTVKEPLPVILETSSDDLDVAPTWLKQRNFRLRNKKRGGVRVRFDVGRTDCASVTLRCTTSIEREVVLANALNDNIVKHGRNSLVLGGWSF